MRALLQASNSLGRGALLALAFVFLQSVKCPDIDYSSGVKRDKVDAFPTYEEVWCQLVKELSKGKKVAFTSLYRTPADQEKACMDICGKKCCSGLCACPGRSNHQNFATADVGNLPGDVQAGCQFLLKVCNEIKACGKNVGCEIGGYGAGAHHLAADEGVRNNAYNQCAFLKGQVSQSPGGSCKGKKDDKPNKPQQPRDQKPPNPDPAQQAQQANDLMKQVMNPEQGRASPPSQGAREAHGATSPTPDQNSAASSSPEDGSAKKIARIGPAVLNPLSDITKGKVGGLERDGSSDSPGAGKSSSPPGFAPGGMGKSGGSAGNFGGASSFGVNSGGSLRNERKETNETLASFAGGNKFLGKANNPNAMAGPETDAAVKDTMKEFSQMLERDPASSTGSMAAGDEIGAAESETLFSRCHEAYVRSLRGGKVSSR